MNAEQVYKLTNERIAASREQAVRGLVRANAMLNDEVAMLREEISRLQAVIRVCAGCVWLTTEQQAALYEQEDQDEDETDRY